MSNDIRTCGDESRAESERKLDLMVLSSAGWSGDEIAAEVNRLYPELEPLNRNQVWSHINRIRQDDMDAHGEA